MLTTQSKQSKQPTLGFVGAGKLATGVARALATAGYHVANVASRSLPSAQALAAHLPGCTAQEHAQRVVDQSDLVFLSVPDDSIASTAQSLTWRRGVAVVHCSGAAELTVLDAAAAQGAAVGGFHNLQMFTDTESAIRGLPGSAIALEAQAPLLDTLREMTAALGCVPLTIPAGSRALYHAGANYVGAFAITLLREATTIWKSFGISEAEAVRALIPLLHGTANSAAAKGAAGGMAGPISRGDTGTVARHLAALDALDPKIGDFYRELARRAVPLGVERGSLKPAQAGAIIEIVRDRA